MKASHSKLGRAIGALILPLLLVGSMAPAAVTSAAPNAAPVSATAFRDTMRKLWEDHITWTRLYIISAAADLPEKDATTQRLLQNQVDIGDAIKPYYGDAAGGQLTALLKDHILDAAALLTAAKAGNDAGVQDASTKWYANADDIATFLNTANPENWPLDTMKSAMKAHLDQTLQEAVDHLKGNYAADEADYDQVHEHILMMADMLSDGIIKQFPDMFTTTSSEAETSFHQTMRKLWEDHITWTRLFIVSASAGLPNTDSTTQRLLQNQVDLGDAVKAFYGNAAGDQLAALLKDHILDAAALLTAAKAGDDAGVKTASDKWYANANDIAAFLNSANPDNWPLATLQSSMKAHLDQTLQEAVDHLKGNYSGDVADYDQVHEHILMMADTLSSGIIAQFPAQFGVSTVAPPAGMPRTGAPGQDAGVFLGQVLIISVILLAAGTLVLRRSALHK
jgi:hypothetical protein